MTQELNQSVEAVVVQLEEICGSDLLALDTLSEKINLLPPNLGLNDAIRKSTFLHRACLNSRVTLEVVQCILHHFPHAASVKIEKICPDECTSAYPLHCACFNSYCPDSIVVVLAKEGPQALSHFCLVGDGVNSGEYDDIYVQGLPLHYYLSRQHHLHLETVKLLIQAYPRALTLTLTDQRHHDFVCYPVHALLSNPNIHELTEVLLCLLEAEHSSILAIDGYNRVSMHVACRNEGMTLDIIQILVTACREACRRLDISDQLPIHTLCTNEDLDETAWCAIFEFLVELDPSFVRNIGTDREVLPIHLVASTRSSIVCKLLIDSYPESVNVRDGDGSLPIHHACASGTIDTVKFLLEHDPQSIHARDNNGCIPIHWAAGCMDIHANISSIELLAACDPVSASKESGMHRRLPLHFACRLYRENLRAVEILFDAYPDALRMADGNGKTPLHHARRQAARNPENSTVVAFLRNQITYAHRAKDITAMHTLDPHGWLPIHHALQSNATLGAIKLLVKENPSALRISDNQLSSPLHIACAFSSVKVVELLLETDNIFENHANANGDTPLHFACRGGNCSVVIFLMNRGNPSVSERNVYKRLPIHLLHEVEEEKVDRSSPGYLEAIWSLLKAHPECLFH